jgi:hypothetical protein
MYGEQMAAQKRAIKLFRIAEYGGRSRLSVREVNQRKREAKYCAAFEPVLSPNLSTMVLHDGLCD